MPDTPPESQLEPEFHDTFHAWRKAPGPETAGALLTAVSPVIDSAMSSFGAGGDVLRGRARRIVLDSLPGYDPARAKLKPFLTSHLQGLRRHAQQASAGVRVPEQVLLDQGRLRDMEGFLHDQLGRPPSDSELADHTSLSLKRIAKVRGASTGMPEGAVSAAGEGGDERFDPVVLGRGGDEDAWNDFVYHSLEPTDQYIMEHTLGLRGKPVLETRRLAERLRLTPSAVSQRKAKIQRTLAERGGLGVL